MESHAEPLSDIARYIENHRNIGLGDKERDFDNLMRYLKPFKTVNGDLNMLEAGTGMGWVPIIAKKRGLRLRGVEISPQLVEAGIEYGRRHGVEPDIIVGNIETSDLGENVYDVIIANSVFEHVEYWKRGLATLYRALKPGGVLFFESTNKWSLTSGEVPAVPCYGWMPNWMRYGFRKILHGKDIMQNGIDFHQFTYRGLRRAFRELGFSKSLDRVALVNPDEVQSPLKRRVLNACKSNAVVKGVVLTFFETTTFVCVK